MVAYHIVIGRRVLALGFARIQEAYAYALSVDDFDARILHCRDYHPLVVAGQKSAAHDACLKRNVAFVGGGGLVDHHQATGPSADINFCGGLCWTQRRQSHQTDQYAHEFMGTPVQCCANPWSRWRSSKPNPDSCLDDPEPEPASNK